MKWFILIPLLSLAGGVAHANESANPSPCTGGISYNPLGYFWAVTPPAATNPIQIAFHEVGPTNTAGQTIAVNEAAAAINRGFAQWMGSFCGGGSPNIAVTASPGNYSANDRGDEWTDVGLIRSKNVVLWDKGDATEWSAGTVAYTEALYLLATGYMIDADMMFNDRDFKWRTVVGGVSTGCTRGEADCYDIETVALHEVGHFLGFGHVDCTDAIMYRTGGGTSEGSLLSEHDVAGLCTLYPERRDGAIRDGGETCTNNAQCPDGHGCIVWPAGSDVGFGSCAELCTADVDCHEGFRCVTEAVNNPEETLSFCRPGLPDESSVGDLCRTCSRGSDCETGLCATDGTNFLCSKPCIEDGECPTGFLCSQSGSSSGVCWPIDTANCGEDTRSQLNDRCYEQATTGSSNDEWFNPCGPGLICFHFKPRCGRQAGACVLYCDAGTACPDENLDCCFGVDEAGSCLSPTAQRRVGGCFDVRQEGEACVAAEQSVCDSGLGCFDFGDPTLAKCYELCAQDGSCDGQEVCSTERFGSVLADGCGNEFELCCDTSTTDDCRPGQAATLQQVGMACHVNADCESGLCLKYRGEAACSRSCDLQTGVGCPADDHDVDGDGIADGGFECLDVNGQGQCWPKEGPVGEPPAGGLDEAVVAPPTGCCSVVGRSPALANQLFNLLLWLPFVAVWRRSQKRC